MIEFRIVSNGINYRVQWLGKTLFLGRPKWKWLFYYNYDSFWIAEFSSVEEAQKNIDMHLENDTSKKRGYVPIKKGLKNESNSNSKRKRKK